MESTESVHSDVAMRPEHKDAASAAQTIDDQPSLLRIMNGLRALSALRKNPDDTELALRAAVRLNLGGLRRIVAQFKAQPEGRELLSTQPAIDCENVDLNALANLPRGTLGRSYSEFLRARNLTPAVFVAPQEIGDADARYVAQRLRQTHDLWHVVTGYDTDVLGEVELQAFVFGQMRLLFSLLVAVFGVSRTNLLTPRIAARVWAAYKQGQRAEPLAWRVWERHFAMPLPELRRTFKLA